jgi:hypothetical protein
LDHKITKIAIGKHINLIRLQVQNKRLQKNEKYRNSHLHETHEKHQKPAENVVHGQKASLNRDGVADTYILQWAT